MPPSAEVVCFQVSLPSAKIQDWKKIIKKKAAFMSAAMQYAATSDAQKGFTASGVDSSSYRFLMTFSSVVRLMTFPWFNLAQ